MTDFISVGSRRQIDPVSIEGIANKHPLVAIAAATSMPDPYFGEVLVMYVVVESGKSCVPEEVDRHLAVSIMDASARPKAIFIVDELPTTAVGAIDRGALRLDAVARAARSAMMALAAATNAWMEVETGGVPPALKVTVLSSKSDRNALRQAIAAILDRYPLPYEIHFAKSANRDPA